MAVAVGFLVILTGENPVSLVRTTILRVSLSFREDELQASVSQNTDPIRFVVNLGDAPFTIATNLRNANLILDADLFVDYLQVEGLDRELEAGTYFLNQSQTIPEIAVQLTDSSNSFILFRVPEGSRIEEVAEFIDGNSLFGFSGQNFLNFVGAGAILPSDFAQQMGIPNGASLEGFLFPDTYQLPPDISPEELREILITNFQSQATEQMRIDASERGLSMYDIVTFASIIEREAVWDDEMPMIASVYQNRYFQGMLLEADPTVQYGINGSRESWWPNITLADYRNVISPHNTYINAGLPPSPIANPSLAAIQAAVYPEKSEFFFFRAKCDGSNYHQFARTFDEHLANACS